jgi:UPF0716 protein FxsA
MYLFLAFLLVPLIEIALFIQVGGAIGLWPTLLIVILTAVLGTFLVRSQGLMALAQLKASFSDLRDPTEPLAHGAMILFSGALLLTPGFFTDALGFALLVPAVRAYLYRYIRSRVTVSGFGPGPADPRARPGPRRPDTPGEVIEGDYHEVTPEADRQGRPSGWTKRPDRS